MGQTLLEKLNILFSAKLHDIVNRALQRNPIQVLNEYLRQHEDAYDQLEADLALTGGKVKTAGRHLEGYKGTVNELTAQIEAIYSDNDPGNDHLATNLGADLVGKEDLLANANRTFEAAQRAHSALLTARGKLQGRIISLRNQIALLEAIQTEADIKGMTADILIRSARMVSSGITSVEGLAESIRQNRDKADAKFELALSKIESSGAESIVQGRADARLAEIRARLGINTEAAKTETPSLDMSQEDLENLAVNQ